MLWELQKVLKKEKLGNISQDWPCTVLLTESPVQEDLAQRLCKCTAKIQKKKEKKRKTNKKQLKAVGMLQTAISVSVTAKHHGVA